MKKVILLFLVVFFVSCNVQPISEEVPEENIDHKIEIKSLDKDEYEIPDNG
ncbi:hypothetical protein [Aquimarina algiphila]|uniref:hypothetical protein n=1 Tax=Aquimarina algiphila TaxID=2047982 RepID=UPI00142F7154|nr:hypothetical protein [Aquimarina algiphila]